MFTFRGNAAVSALVRDFYEAGKISALVCHATCVLLETRLSSGELLVAGKTWTGFANAEEKFADDFVGRRIQPFGSKTRPARSRAPTSWSIRPFDLSPCGTDVWSRVSSRLRAQRRQRS